MSELVRRIRVKTQFRGFHRWKDAPKQVAFLRDYHRHVFHVEIEMNVTHGDRELEFFIIQSALDSYIKTNIFGKWLDMSCEDIAEQILVSHLREKYGENRAYKVTVSEDGENAGIVFEQQVNE